eukprot:COSAG06_NODE_38240_length_425_cov_4.628834_1_plen_38_part_01
MMSTLTLSMCGRVLVAGWFHHKTPKVAIQTAKCGHIFF